MSLPDLNSPLLTYLEKTHVFREEYNVKMSAAREELRKAQKTCRHKKTSFYPDPAGGSDSYNECCWCGVRF